MTTTDCPSRVTLVTLDNLSADDLAHDLVRAAVYSMNARVCEGSRDRVLHHVPVPAEQLHALVEYFPLSLGCPELHLRSFFGGEVAFAVEFDRAINVRP